ncbi:flagellar hook-length control protein FliK [Senegalia massiliensis]|uniref:flagellar hook-length control protein FliK n=1 Tax=Senegalia massiliensis TaxID=1720316 RepID=UPI0010301A49|nr:flagellar hook-length control protein FliK [Senegalia massiliensis]
MNRIEGINLIPNKNLIKTDGGKQKKSEEKDSNFYNLLNEQVDSNENNKLKKYEFKLDEKKSNKEKDEIKNTDIFFVTNFNAQTEDSLEFNFQSKDEVIISKEILEEINMLMENLNLKETNNDKMNIMQKIKELVLNMETINLDDISISKEIQPLLKQLDGKISVTEGSNDTLFIENELNKILKELNTKLNLEQNKVSKIEENIKKEVENYNLVNNELNEKEQSKSNIYTFEKDINLDKQPKSQNNIVDENIILKQDNIDLNKNIMNVTKVTSKDNLSSNIMEKYNILEQINSNIKFIDNEGVKIARINLNPESLGKIMIKLDMDEGNIIGRILVENTDVKNLLENNINSLKETFSSKGILLKEMNVTVGQESFSNGDQQNFFKKYYSKRKNKSNLEKDESEYEELIFNNYGRDYIVNGSLDIKA